jgi:glycosyltransferase involved in cell wall biosynthesis
MKILMILDREFPSDLRVENEMEALKSRGHEIHLACFTRKDRTEYDETDLCHIHRKPISGLVYKSSVGALTTPVYFNFWRRFLGDISDVHTFDAVHVHDLPLAKVAAEYSKKHTIPLTVDLHENWPAYLRIATHTRSMLGRLLSPDRKWVEYEKKILLEAHNIIVVVDEAAKRLAELGLAEEKIHVVSNTLNIDHFNRTDATGTHEGTILFYAGGLNYHRGLQVVIHAIASAIKSNPGIRFWILGEGSYRQNLEELAKKLGVTEQIIFKGWQPYEKMAEMMMESDYALIPHLRSDHTDSTIPHKLFQYMYAGKPVIASDCKPIARIVNETKTGYIYASEKSGELAGILENLSKDETISFGRNGIKWVKEKYNWTVDSQVLNNIYRMN